MSRRPKFDDALAFFKHIASDEGWYDERFHRMVAAIRANRRHPHAAPFIKVIRQIARAMRDANARGDRARAELEYERFSTAMVQMRRAYELPFAREGKLFRDHRRPKKSSPIRQAIAHLLHAVPNMEPREVWDALADKPPRGWTFRDNRQGKYIEGPKASDGMSYHSFQTLVAEVRRLGR